MSQRIIICVRCHREGRHQGRGLCNPCYKTLHRDGGLEDYPRMFHAADEVLDDWVFLRDQGYTIRNAAPRMGMTFAALEKALERAKKRGDQRGNRWPFGRQLSRDGIAA